MYGHTTDDTLAPLNASPKSLPNPIEEIKMVIFKIEEILELRLWSFIGVPFDRGGGGIGKKA